ncbi:MAG: ATPase [Candidatus Micrarchaeia archaeon]
MVAETTASTLSTAALAIGAAVSILGGAIATAWAQSSIGSAAMGVIAERPEESGKLLVYLVIPETIVIFGFVIAIMLTLRI